jgi:hypothetical protein
VLRTVSRRFACTADGKMCGVGPGPYSRCALDGLHPLKPSAPTPRQALDLTLGVTKRATRLFTCNTTFPVTTQTLARKSPAQQVGIRCEASTHWDPRYAGESIQRKFNSRCRDFRGEILGAYRCEPPKILTTRDPNLLRAILQPIRRQSPQQFLSQAIQHTNIHRSGRLTHLRSSG